MSLEDPLGINQFLSRLPTILDDGKVVLTSAGRDISTTAAEQMKGVIDHFFAELDKRLPLTIEVPFLSDPITIASPMKKPK